MNCWNCFVIFVISTCTATEILYVLPDNVSDVNCPSQPCHTLDQYLLDSRSLPVLSNVEYRFLPGEHYVVKVISIELAVHLTLSGSGLSPAKLVCLPVTLVSIYSSYNITIRNLVFDQCNANVLFSEMDLDIAAGLFLYDCMYCIVENIKFFGYGFTGINLALNSYLNNITIDMTIVKPAMHLCSPKFFLIFVRTGYVNEHIHQFNDVLINQVSISGYNEMCYEYHEAMQIRLYKSYGIKLKLLNSQFYHMNQMALHIQMQFTSALLLIENCTFKYIIHKTRLIDKTVYGKLSINHVAIRFENCTFYNNLALAVLGFNFEHYEGSCLYQSIVTLANCDFVNNNGGLLILVSLVAKCKAIIILHEVINFAKNEVDFIMYFSYMTVGMNGIITVSENNVKDDMMLFENCDAVFTNVTTFNSNICYSVITLISLRVNLTYLIIMEYANITFINITYNHLAYATGPVAEISNFLGAFPYCIFQYKLSSNFNNDDRNISELLALYTISFIDNKHEQVSTNYFDQISSDIDDFMDHCEWLPTAIFNGYSPGYINQHIVKVNDRQWIHHKEICHCPHDGPYDCTVDLLGPVYPGQKLQVELCMPQAKSNFNYVYIETHSTSLPSSACRIAHQTELTSSIATYSKTLNFTIISAGKSCELFLIVQNYIRSVFYVQLLPCPVGFTLQNKKCDCDPFLPPDIDTCFIDLSAIRRPANTYITAHTLTNNTTNYLISDCPMDYCLPYSTNVDLVHPDLQCQFNRTGILCSQCPHPLSMVFASSRCMKCTNVHILITIIVIVAGIVLVMLLYVLNLTVTNGTINGIIFYANIVSINDSVFLVNDSVFKPLRVFLSFTNLDLGIETCFYNGMDSYVKMWLQLFFPSYLIIIAVSIIIASRYSSRILRLTYSRSLPVLATLFLLSYTGVLRVVLTVLFSYSTITHYPSGDKQIVWSVDASVPLFGVKFTILFITCLVLFLILIPFNITLLFTRYLSRFIVVNHFKPLLDAFQGSHKDKYYYWIAVQLMFRSIFFSLYAFQVKLRLILATILLMIFTGYYGYLQPNKNKIVNFQELSILINLTIMYAVSVKDNEKIFSIVTNVMIGLAFIQFCIIVIYHILAYTYRCKFSIKKKLALLFTTKKSNHLSFNVALLDIPERTYNYSEYQDGLVSDDFNICK